MYTKISLLLLMFSSLAFIPPKKGRADVSCPAEGNLTTGLGVINMRNIDIGQVLIYDKDTKTYSDTKIRLPKSILAKVNKGQESAERLTKIEKGLDVAVHGSFKSKEVASIKSSIESIVTSEFNLEIFNSYWIDIPEYLAELSGSDQTSDTWKFRLNLSQGDYNVEKLPKNKILCIVDRVLHAKKIEFSSKTKKVFNAKNEANINVGKIEVAVSVNSNCNSFTKISDQNNYHPVIYGASMVEFSNDYWKFKILTSSN